MDTTPASSWLEGNPGVDHAQRPGRPGGHSVDCPEVAERGHASGQGGDEDTGREDVWREEMRPRQQLHPRDQSGRRGRFWGTTEQGPRVRGAQQCHGAGREAVQSPPHCGAGCGCLGPCPEGHQASPVFLPTQEQGWNQIERGGAPEKPTGQNQK